MSEQGGRSGAFIFATDDQKYVLKTITKSEKEFFFESLFERYMERVMNFPDSKLVRILGVYKINPMKQNVILMENILPYKEKSLIFDLKGSKVSRLVKGIENPSIPPLGQVLKDENFLLYNKKLALKENTKLKLFETLRQDFALLKDSGVIDYSLLLGLYPENFESINSCYRDEESKIFTLGIIDIFQQYNFLKASEKRIKSIFNKKEDISIASPNEYFNRISKCVHSICQ